VFKKRNVDTLPRHQSYDYTIQVNLLEGVQLPFRPINNLSQDEVVVLCEYLDENFKKGFI
jgi:hypothetical protein